MSYSQYGSTDKNLFSNKILLQSSMDKLSLDKFLEPSMFVLPSNASFHDS